MNAFKQDLVCLSDACHNCDESLLFLFVFLLKTKMYSGFCTFIIYLFFFFWFICLLVHWFLKWRFFFSFNLLIIYLWCHFLSQKGYVGFSVFLFIYLLIYCVWLMKTRLKVTGSTHNQFLDSISQQSSDLNMGFSKIREDPKQPSAHNHTVSFQSDQSKVVFSPSFSWLYFPPPSFRFFSFALISLL